MPDFDTAGLADHLADVLPGSGTVTLDKIPGGMSNPTYFMGLGGDPPGRVLGAGAMGRGIAMAFARTGRTVVLADPAPEARAAARAHLTAMAGRQRAKGTLNDSGHAALLARITLVEGVDAFAGACLAVEAVPEVLPLKQAVLAGIEAALPPGASITSNTSTLDVDALAGVLRHLERFIGTHVFMPAQVNRLLELVPSSRTAPDMLVAALRWPPPICASCPMHRARPARAACTRTKRRFTPAPGCMNGSGSARMTSVCSPRRCSMSSACRRG